MWYAIHELDGEVKAKAILANVWQGDTLQWKNSGAQQLGDALTTRLLELGRIVALGLYVPDHRLSDWTAFIEAIAANKIKLESLALRHQPDCDALYAAIVAALATNHTIAQLAIIQGAEELPRTKAALFAMLPARSAPLTLHVGDTYCAVVDFFGSGIDPSTNSPALPRWKCVLEGGLSIPCIPRSWAQLHGLHLRRLSCLNNKVDVPTFLKNNEIECIHFGGAGRGGPIPFSNSLITAFANQPYESLSVIHRSDVPAFKCWRQNGVDDALSDTIPALFPNIRIMLEPLTPAQAGLLADRRELWPNLQSCLVLLAQHSPSNGIAQHSPSNGKELTALLTSRPQLTELHISVNETSEASGQLLSAALARANVVRLTVEPGPKTNFLQLLRPSLQHPDCVVQYLHITNSLNDRQVATIGKLFRSNRTVRVIATPAVDSAANLALHEVARQNRQLLAVMPVGAAPWGNAPSTLQALLDWEPQISEHKKDFYEYRATREMLRNRQLRFVLHRDAWQRAAFALGWFRANLHSALRDSCFALLPCIRELTGGAATSGFEASRQEWDRFDPMLSIWSLQDDNDAITMIKDKPLNVQRLVDTRFGLAATAPKSR